MAVDWGLLEQEMAGYVTPADLDALADNRPDTHGGAAIAGVLAGPVLLLLAVVWVIGWWLL